MLHLSGWREESTAASLRNSHCLHELRAETSRFAWVGHANVDYQHSPEADKACRSRQERFTGQLAAATSGQLRYFWMGTATAGDVKVTSPAANGQGFSVPCQSICSWALCLAVSAN